MACKIPQPDTVIPIPKELQKFFSPSNGAETVTSNALVTAAHNINKEFAKIRNTCRKIRGPTISGGGRRITGRRFKYKNKQSLRRRRLQVGGWPLSGLLKNNLWPTLILIIFTTITTGYYYNFLPPDLATTLEMLLGPEGYGTGINEKGGARIMCDNAVVELIEYLPSLTPYIQMFAITHATSNCVNTVMPWINGVRVMFGLLGWTDPIGKLRSAVIGRWKGLGTMVSCFLTMFELLCVRFDINTNTVQAFEGIKQIFISVKDTPITVPVPNTSEIIIAALPPNTSKDDVLAVTDRVGTAVNGMIHGRLMEIQVQRKKLTKVDELEKFDNDLALLMESFNPQLESFIKKFAKPVLKLVLAETNVGEPGPGTRKRSHSSSSSSSSSSRNSSSSPKALSAPPVKKAKSNSVKRESKSVNVKSKSVRGKSNSVNVK